MTSFGDIYSDRGQWLCHYTRADTAFEHILVPGGSLKMNPYGLMRDPLEAQPPFVSPRFAPDLSVEEFGSRLEVALGPYRASRDRYRLLSLTQQGEPDGRTTLSKAYAKPWSRARMWEQYADAHQGVCLIFDKLRLVGPIDDDPRYLHKAVRYTREGYASSKAAAGLQVQDFTLDDAERFIARYVEDHRDDFFFLKSGDWEAEHEYRVLFETDDHGGMPSFLPCGDALRYVVLGARFPEWQIPAAIAAVAKLPRHVDLCWMNWKDGYPLPGVIVDQALNARWDHTPTTDRDLEEAPMD